jgi:hypothetical protein
VFEKYRSVFKGPPIGIRGMQLAHAHTLILSGDAERGRELAKTLLQLFDAEEVGRPRHFFARERASAYAMLGDHERAIAELTNSIGRRDFIRWWYTAERDALFAPLRTDRRFQVLLGQASQHRLEQRALLDAMRRNGEVPKRP